MIAPRTRTALGYTLVELSVVLLILGILLAGIAIPLSTQLGNARYQQAREELEQIKEALIAYAIADPNNRLPCPDSDSPFDGVPDSDGSGHDCDTSSHVEGFLPWRDLGAPRVDPWGNPYRYRADVNYNDATGVDPPDAPTGGPLDVNDAAGTDLTSGNPLGPAAIVFSCGPDGVPNLENSSSGGAGCSNGNASNAVYTQNSPIEGGANDFDDVLTILSKHVLLHRLVQSQQWP